ncbi:MAG: relaxase/mobilization nuclease domain-containing protein [Hyphomicrobiaceae bacterium]
MIPRLHKRGQSFKGAFTYILHDPGETSAHRVLWTQSVNLEGSPDDAWRAMHATWRDRVKLKRAAGVDLRGRDNKKPVLHMTLSWHADDAPTPEHMRETALSALRAIGLDRHQALMAAHDEKEHLHVHLVINTVDPENGRTAPMKYTKERLSRWAEAYEEQHGLRIEQRVDNNRKRDEIKAAREHENAEAEQAAEQEQKAKAPYEPVKHQPVQRKEWIEKQAIIDRMKRLRAEYDRRHLTERGITWARHRQEFAELVETTTQATDQARNHVNDQYRRRWRELYAAQRKEARHVSRQDTHIFERAVYVFVNSERLGNGKPLSMKRKVQLILSQRKLDDAVRRMHRRERVGLSQMQKADRHELVERAMRAHEPRFTAMKARHAAERAAELTRQKDVTRRSVDFLRAKNQLKLERTFGEPVRMAADAPPMETDAGYVARIRAEIQASYERRRGSDTPKLEPLSPAPPASPEPSNDARSPSVSYPFNETALPATKRRAAGIRRDMEEWRKRNKGRDFGREI